MINEHILQHMDGLQKQLIAAFDSGKMDSNATKGRAREIFVSNLLKVVMPQIFRFGNGDITDTDNQRTGQVDIVIEYPFFPSFPSIIGDSCGRLYLSEGVAAVIEVKSQIDQQWKEVEETARKVKILQRKLNPIIYSSNFPLEKIPFFAVGYSGWKDDDTVLNKLKDSPNVDAILIIDSGKFAAKNYFPIIQANGSWGLSAFITCLHHAMTAAKLASCDLSHYGSGI